MVRALAIHQCESPVEFVVGSRPCSEGFSPGTPVFFPPQNPTSPNSNPTKSHSLEVPLKFAFHNLSARKKIRGRYLNEVLVTIFDSQCLTKFKPQIPIIQTEFI